MARSLPFSGSPDLRLHRYAQADESAQGPDAEQRPAYLRLSGSKKGDKALLCMPLRYIAGKMMVVRSLYAGLDLEVREPSGHPLADWGDTPLRFAAMIPLQVYNTLRVPEERKRLEQTDI